MQNKGDFQVSKRGTGVGFLVEREMMKMNTSFGKEKHKRQTHVGYAEEEEEKERTRKKSSQTVLYK